MSNISLKVFRKLINAPRFIPGDTVKVLKHIRLDPHIGKRLPVGSTGTVTTCWVDKDGQYKMFISQGDHSRWYFLEVEVELYED